MNYLLTTCATAALFGAVYAPGAFHHGNSHFAHEPNKHYIFDKWHFDDDRDEKRHHKKKNH